MKRFLTTIFVVILFVMTGLAQSTTSWIGDTDSLWHNAANWSNGIPSDSMSVYFDESGLNNCHLNADVVINHLTVDGFSGSIELNGNALNVNSASANLTFKTGTINDALSTGSVNISNAAATYFSGTEFSVKLNVESGSILLNGSVFNDNSVFTKTGSDGADGKGGNTFNGVTTIINLGSGMFQLGKNNPDVFNEDVFFSSQESQIVVARGSEGTQFNGNIELESTNGIIQFGINGGTSFLADGKTVSVGPGGYAGPKLEFRDFTQIGDTPQSLSLGAESSMNLVLVRSVWFGDLNTSAPSISLKGSTFHGIASFAKIGDSGNTSYGGNTFNGTSHFKTDAEASYWILSTSAPDIFNGRSLFTQWEEGFM